MEILTAWLASIPACSAPFLLATIGLIINERAGVSNLGVEGIMAIAAVVAVILDPKCDNVLLALLGAMTAGLLLTAVFAIMAVVLRVDQVLAGLVVFALGIGISGFVGDAYQNQPIPGISILPTEWFARMPRILRGILDQDFLTYFAFLGSVAVWFTIHRSRLGLRLRAVGEDAPAADAAGVSVLFVRIGAVLIGGCFCALAGAHLSFVGSHLWVDGMVAGRGWIAVAMVTLSHWNALRAIASAILFGAVEALVPQLLSSGNNIPVYLVQMAPYLATLAYLFVAGWFASSGNGRPADLGRPFLREERR
jgi:ABC-type uncharacterized transport system permease subunit